MRRLVLLLSGVSLGLCVAQSLFAQSLDVPRGAQVRVTPTSHRYKPVTGTVDSVSDGVITIRTGRFLSARLPISQVDRVEVLRGQTRPMWSKTAPLWLTLSAAGVGALLGSATEPENSSFARDDSAMAGAAVFGILGLVVGTGLAIGVTHETWEPVFDSGRRPQSSGTAPIYVAPRAGGLAVGLHAAF